MSTAPRTRSLSCTGACAARPFTRHFEEGARRCGRSARRPRGCAAASACSAGSLHLSSSRLARPITIASGLFSSCATPASRLPIAAELLALAQRLALALDLLVRRRGARSGRYNDAVKKVSLADPRAPQHHVDRELACRPGAARSLSTRRPIRRTGSPRRRRRRSSSRPSRWLSGTIVPPAGLPIISSRERENMRCAAGLNSTIRPCRRW